MSKTVFSLIIAFGLIFAIIPSSFAASHMSGTGMEITATADDGSDTIFLSGHTSIKNNDITIKVTAPNGNIIAVDQLTPDANGDFNTELKTGLSWSQDGQYTISVQQGSNSLYNLSVKVGVSGGMAEATMVTDSSLVDENVSGGGTGILDEERGLTITADAVVGSTTIGISGHTDRLNVDVTLTVKSPNGNIVSVDQLTPDANGDFNTELKTGSQLWSEDGIYTVTAQQGETARYKDTAMVDIKDGAVIPEFGTIAALILAVAIMSIIAVSAKTRLNIMPKI